MSAQGYVCQLLSSSFQQLTKSSFIDDAKTNWKCVPASQKTIPVFACGIVLNLRVNNLRETQCFRPICDPFAFMLSSIVWKNSATSMCIQFGAMDGSKRRKFSISGFTVQTKHATNKQNHFPTYMQVTDDTFKVRLCLIQNAGIGQALSSKIMVIAAKHSRLMGLVV